MIEAHRDGCWLRATDSRATWWAGAALLHGAGPPTFVRAATAEAFYTGLGERTRIQVCPDCPADLDQVLTRRHYITGDVVSLRLLNSRVPAPEPAPGLHLTLRQRLDRSWFSVWMAVQGPEVEPGPEWRLFERVDQPSVYATVSLHGRPVSIGRAVTDTGWTGIFNMATLPEARRRGAARAVLAGLTGWAHEGEQTSVYLQVEAESSTASHLYEGAGFEEVCVYHYRTTADVPHVS